MRANYFTEPGAISAFRAFEMTPYAVLMDGPDELDVCAT
jgi:hypothetical protein